MYQVWKDRKPLSVDEVVRSSSLNTNGDEDAGSNCDAPDDDDGSTHNENGGGDGNVLIAVA